jgi:hypothetical protein
VREGVKVTPSEVRLMFVWPGMFNYYLSAAWRDLPGRRNGDRLNYIEKHLNL